MALHLIHKATPSLMRRAGKCIAEGDCIVFMHTDIPAIESCLTALPDTIPVHILDGNDARNIDMNTLVTLTTRHTPIVSWF